MRSSIINELWDEDIDLFESVSKNYQSENEKRFFEYLKSVQLWDLCLSGELLLSESDNDEHFFIFRIEFNEYQFGKVSEDAPDTIHTMSLSELLSINLKQSGFSKDNHTVFEWLKQRDYKGIRYDQNKDFE